MSKLRRQLRLLLLVTFDFAISSPQLGGFCCSPCYQILSSRGHPRKLVTKPCNAGDKQRRTSAKRPVHMRFIYKLGLLVFCGFFFTEVCVITIFSMFDNIIVARTCCVYNVVTHTTSVFVEVSWTSKDNMQNLLR